jgi:putative transposase
MAIFVPVMLWMLWRIRWRWLGRCVVGHGRRRRSPGTIPAVPIRSAKKPDWVGRELVRIKAWSPQLGCRVIAEVFNRQFAERRITVSKSHVNDLLRRKRLDVLRLRRALKHRTPRSMDRNLIWAMDLTGKADLTGQQRIALGLLDHGTRAALRLIELRDKSSLTILRELIGAIRQSGIPRAIRTDNEACFTSRTMRIALAALGIQHQKTELHCPWQNGRIERFFGTFKRHIDKIQLIDGEDLRIKLIEFRCWYNHARPHQHLDGRTPAEA